MTIEDVQYGEFELASVDTRSDNFSVDFVFSSALSGVILYFLWDQFWLAIGLVVLVKILYYFLFEYFYGKTLGKILSHTKVISTDGSRPTAVQLLKRSLTRFIGVVNFVSDDRFAYHDSISNTRVVVDSNQMDLNQIRIKGFINVSVMGCLWLSMTPRDFIPNWIGLSLLSALMLGLTFYLLSKLKGYAKNHRI